MILFQDTAEIIGQQLITKNSQIASSYSCVVSDWMSELPLVVLWPVLGTGETSVCRYEEDRWWSAASTVCS